MKTILIIILSIVIVALTALGIALDYCERHDRGLTRIRRLFFHRNI